MVPEPAKRSRGRPKGSKNKRKQLSEATVRQICDHHRFNPAEKLIAIATGADDDDWDKTQRLRATEKLFDAIHNNRKLPGELDDSERNQYEIVFIEGAPGVELPGAGHSGGFEEVLRQQPIQRAGLPQADG